jgi:hypothetical protein
VHRCADAGADRQPRRRRRQRGGRQVPASQQGGAGLPDGARSGAAAGCGAGLKAVAETATEDCAGCCRTGHLPRPGSGPGTQGVPVCRG